MKKLMIAAAIVCAATVSQAAYFQWKTAKSNNVNNPEGLTQVASTAYIFEASKIGDVFALWAAGEDWTGAALDSADITAAGKISVNDEAFNYGTKGESGYLDAIFAVAETIGGQDYFYVSTTAGDTGPGSGATTLSFSEGGVSTAIKDASAGYAGAGWYTAVPEPTSGLLLLLGVAGLALRRRRA